MRLARLGQLLVGTSLAASAPTWAGTLGYSYDELGRIKTAAYPDGATVLYCSDKAGNSTKYVVTSSTPSCNSPPVANNDTLTTTQNTPASLDPRVNDTDPDGDALTISAVTSGAHGTVTNNSGASVTYTPTTGYMGADAFTYTVSDGNGGVATATVGVTVAAGGPVAGNDSIFADIRAGVISGCTTLLANDSDPNGYTLTVTSMTNPSFGTLSTKAGLHGATATCWTYSRGGAGADSFTYTISNGHGGTATATVNVTWAF